MLARRLFIVTIGDFFVSRRAELTASVVVAMPLYICRCTVVCSGIGHDVAFQGRVAGGDITDVNTWSEDEVLISKSSFLC